jgi:AcrR family transcriptional regulator
LTDGSNGASEKRRLILEAAVRVFARKGFHTCRVDALRTVEESDDAAREQLRKAAAIVLRTWRRDADLVRVLVREVTRSAALQREVEELGLAFAAIERIIRGGQERGELRTDLDARLAAFVFYGALEAILTGWVVGQLDDGEDDVAHAERTVVEIVTSGLGEAVLATDR